MAESPFGTPDGENSVQGGNNHLLESTLARMTSYFERQEGRVCNDPTRPPRKKGRGRPSAWLTPGLNRNNQLQSAEY